MGKKTTTTAGSAREVKRLTHTLLHVCGLAPEVIAVKLDVTVYTVYRWAKGKTGAHANNFAALQRLVAQKHGGGAT